MKRALTLLSAILLAGVFLYACGIIPNVNTSIVTIKIGDTPNRAVLKAEAATPWTRMKYLLAEVDLVQTAEAYIPSVVQAIVVTVTAPDMPVPIVAVGTVGSNDTSALVRIEVPNGSNRSFEVQGIGGPLNEVTYRGNVIDVTLSGADVTISVSLQFVGQAIYVAPPPLGNDTLNTGLTASSPFETISHAVVTQATTTPYNTLPIIVVAQGIYDGTVGAGPAESFPLSLNAGTILLCAGPEGAVVLDDTGTGNAVTGMIIGAQGAVIDGCSIQVSLFWPAAVSDNGTDIVLRDSRIITAPSLAPLGVQLSGTSTVIRSHIEGFNFGDNVGRAIEVIGGSADIFSNNLVDNENGVILSSGDATIEQNLITATTSSVLFYSSGIEVQSSGAIRIRSNEITGYSTGIYIVNWSPDISFNSLHHNDRGISVIGSTGTQPVIKNNSLFCNVSYDLEANVTEQFVATDNSWDHAPPSLETPSVAACTLGTDICYVGILPNYSNYTAPVPGGCP